MTKNHNYYLDLAYQLAEQNLGKTGLNPSVGAIVVKNDSVISSGITSFRGRPHAEFNALSKLKNFAGASAVSAMSTLFRQAIAECIAVCMNWVEFGLVLGLILQIDLLLGNLISSIIIDGSKLYIIFCIHIAA